VIGSKDKQGFETVAQFDQSGSFALAYGLDSDGNILGKSVLVECIDIVEAGAASHQIADSKAYLRPPASPARPPVTGSVATPDAAIESNENVSSKEDVAQSAEWNGSPSATSNKVETGKEQEQKQPTTETTHAENAHPNVVGVYAAIRGNASPRPLTMILFFIVSSAGVLLLGRMRRRVLLAAVRSG